MNIQDFASKLFGSSRIEESGDLSNRVDSITAAGATASEAGAVGVTLDAEITPADDSSETDETIIEMPTSPSVDVGDDVIIGLTGEGPLKVPVVLANPGSGDRVASQAQQAIDIAEATGQHFWDADDGAHVTEVTREEWEDSTSPSYHSGPNSLWNSLGMLFRNGLTNLLAILTDGLAIYDGEGNADDNIVARFTTDLIRIGRLIVGDADYDNTAAVQFFDENASLWVRQYANVDHSTIWRSMGINSALTDTDGYEARGYISESSSLDYGATGTTAEAVIGAYVRREGASGVNARLLLHSGPNNGSRRAELYADTIVLDGSGLEYLHGVYSMKHVIDALTIGTGEITLTNSRQPQPRAHEVLRRGFTCTANITSFQVTTALASGDSVVIATVPAGYRPAVNALAIPYVNNATFAGGLIGAVGTNGNVTLWNYSGATLPTNAYMTFGCTYVLA